MQINMDNCPICRSLLIPAGTDEDPAWVDDPICTRGGLAGIDYIGQTAIRSSHIVQLQIYYSYIANKLGVTLDTWIDIGNGQIKSIHIVQLRVAVEQLLTAVGKTLTDYFKSDKYGNTYTSDQTEWTECDRIDNIPNLPKGSPVRALHIEELRIGMSTGVLTSVEYPRNLSVRFNTTGGLYVVEYSGSFIFHPSSFDDVVEVYQNPIYYGGFGYPEITIINSSAKNFKIKIVFPAWSSVIDIATTLASIKFIIRTSIGNYAFNFGRYGFLQGRDTGIIIHGFASNGRTQDHCIISANQLQRYFGIFLGNYTPIRLQSTFYSTDITNPPTFLKTTDWVVTSSNWIYKSYEVEGLPEMPDIWKYGYEYFFTNVNGGEFGIRGYTYQCGISDPPTDPDALAGSGDFYAKMQKGTDITDIFELTVIHDTSLI